MRTATMPGHSFCIYVCLCMDMCFLLEGCRILARNVVAGENTKIKNEKSVMEVMFNFSSVRLFMSRVFFCSEKFAHVIWFCFVSGIN